VCVEMRTILTLGLVLCLGCLMVSCATLDQFLDTQLGNSETPRETSAHKRVPLPPTIKDFEANPANR
jgi:hypothetical protein